jgi:hypothetical protein
MTAASPHSIPGPWKTLVIHGKNWCEGSLVNLEKSWVDFVDLVDECEVDDVHC